MLGKLRARHIVLALISIAIIVACALLAARLLWKPVLCDTVTITGEINPDMFTNVRACLAGSTALKKTVIIDSGGGDGETALALGMLIHQYGWDVKVQNFCASACANYIFPAGKAKYLGPSALLVFHGGPKQANLREFAKGLASQPAKGKTVIPAVLGVKDKEGILRVTSDVSPALRQVRHFLGVPDTPPLIEVLDNLDRLTDEFYVLLGINPALTSYGQVGQYEETYKSYKFNGFIYSLKSLRKLGLKNIEVKEGEWQPELNPHYKEVYAVAYP